MNFLKLLDDFIDVVEQLNKIIDRPQSLKEDKELTLSDLLKISLNIIEDLDSNFENVLNCNIDEVNKKIDYLMKQLSMFFAIEENHKNNLNEIELKLYNDLVNNLHILSKKSVEFENIYHLGLHTFDKISVKYGIQLLNEGFKYFWDIFEKSC